MIMKRKIDATEDDYDVVITPRSPKSYKTVHTSAAEPLPLTRRNLAELSSKDSTNSISSQSMASSGSRRSSVAITDEERSLAVIKIWGISIHDGQSSLTTPLERLLEAVTEPRESIEVTPNSRKTSALQALFDELPEADMISHLNRHLFYTPSAIPGDEGEPDVWISVDRQWLINTPKPLGVPEKVLQDTIKENGTLPKPKPDFTHGYPDTAFTESQLNRLISLPAHTKVLPGKPWFPWLIVEVKSKQPIAEAQRQAYRDAAAAIAAYHSTLLALTGKEPPSEMTSMFSICIDRNIFQLRLHWRCIRQNRVRWDSHEFYFGFLKKAEDVFRLRGMIYRILHWARQTRLEAVKLALDKGTLSIDIDDITRPNGTPQTLSTSSSSTTVQPDQAILKNKRRRYNESELLDDAEHASLGQYR